MLEGSVTYLVNLLKGVVDEPVDDAGLAHGLISQEHDLILAARTGTALGRKIGSHFNSIQFKFKIEAIV